MFQINVVVFSFFSFSFGKPAVTQIALAERFSRLDVCNSFRGPPEGTCC